MICNECTEAKQVPTCIDTLQIGVVASTNADYSIYIQNNATKYTHRADVESDADGIITLDMTKPFIDFYSENFYFTLWVTEQNGNTEDRVQVTINSIAYDCFLLRFKKVYNDDDIPAEFTNYSLEV